jgi:hypothetical protein
MLGVLAGPFFAGRVYTCDDLGAFHLPVRAFYAEQLHRGEPFDWTPQLFAGFHLGGEGQAGMYHPLHLLLYRVLSLRAALAWEYLASYPWMLAGTYFWLRRLLGRRDAAMFGALAFTFSGFNLLHFIHPNAIAVAAHLPWLLWAIDLALTEPDRRKASAAAVAVALLTGSQLLLGYPQYVWFSLLAEAAYAFHLLILRDVMPLRSIRAGACRPGSSGPTRPGSDLRSATWLSRPSINGVCSKCGLLALAKLAGLLLGGIQLLPSIDALAHSARRTADAGFADWGSLSPANLVQLIAPYLLSHRVVGENTHEEGLYFGAVPLMLIVWVLVRREHLGPWRRPAVAAAAFGGLALLLALGQYGGIYRLQRLLPLVGSFRFPCRYLVLVHLAAAVLAAIGLALLVRQQRRHQVAPWPQLRPLWKVAIASGLLALVGVVLGRRAAIGPLGGVLAGPLLIGAAAALVALAARGVRWAPVGLILFTALDLGVYGFSYAVYRQTYRLDQYAAATLAPPAGSSGRVVFDLLRVDERGVRNGDQVLLAGWCRADGYAGLEPARRLDYHQSAALRAAGVRWVFRGPTTAGVAGLREYDRHWCEVPDPLPRARLVARAEVSDDPARDIGRIPVATAALVEAPVDLEPGDPGGATIVGQRPGRFEICADCPTRQLLVVSEGFHGGWRATIDGRPQEVLRVNGDFLGCVIEPGPHNVVLEFRPRSLRLGALVSCLGLGLVAILFCRSLGATDVPRVQRTGTGETPVAPRNPAMPEPERGAR